MVKATLRLIFVVSLCVGLTGCLWGFVVGMELKPLLRDLNFSNSPPVNPNPLAQAEWERCRESSGKGIEATKPVAIAVPTNEGEVQTFAAMTWQFGFAGEHSPLGRLSPPAGGTLVITERSVLLVSPSDAAGVRIPYQIVENVELNPATPYSMIVKSCTWRYDIFNFWQRQTNKDDPEAAAVAAEQLKSRVAAFQATTLKATDTLH